MRPNTPVLLRLRLGHKAKQVDPDKGLVLVRVFDRTFTNKQSIRNFFSITVRAFCYQFTKWF